MPIILLSPVLTVQAMQQLALKNGYSRVTQLLLIPMASYCSLQIIGKTLYLLLILFQLLMDRHIPKMPITCVIGDLVYIKS